MLMRLSDIILTWYKLASGGQVDQTDIFFRFVSIWIAFNGLYTSRHSRDTGDWDQVRSFAGDSDAIDRHRQLLTTDKEYREAIDVLVERGVGNVSRGGVRRQIRRVDNLTEVLSCVYQVRCNLFHGAKAPGNPRDESLVKASYIIVSKLIEPLLDPGIIDSSA
jgi:hypothetical protein